MFLILHFYYKWRELESIDKNTLWKHEKIKNLKD